MVPDEESPTSKGRRKEEGRRAGNGKTMSSSKQDKRDHDRSALEPILSFVFIVVFQIDQRAKL